MPPWLRPALLLAPAAVGGALCLPSGYVSRTLGVWLLLFAAYRLACESVGIVRRLSDRPLLCGRLSVGLAGALPPLLLFIVAAGLLWPCMLGIMPQSQDHPVHLTRAWHFLTQMLSHGQLSGWSDLWFAGWPAGEDYPPGGDWLISGVYLATFGLLGWESAYAVAFLLMFAGCALAIYHFGRSYFGRSAGFIAGLLFLLDRGRYREGGWNYTVWWGVWPQILSTAFTFLALSLLDRVLRCGRRRDYALCSLAIGLALVCHPVAVVYFGLALPLYVVARALASTEAAGRIVARSLATVALGAALAAFWILPFSAKGVWMAKYGELWKSLPQMAEGLWRGTLFENLTPWIIFAGLLGGALAVWRRHFCGIFLVLYSAVLLFVASSTAFQQLDLLNVSAAFGQIQFQRLAIPAKVCLFLLAGWALRSTFAGRPPADRPLQPKRQALVLICLLTLAPLVLPLLNTWAQYYGGELGRPKTRLDVPHWADYRAFLDWSKGLKAIEKGFFRIAYVRPYNDHFFAAAPVYNGIPAYKVGFTPCTNFIHKPDKADPELYRRLSVKYVVALGPTHGAKLSLQKRFGPIHVYRFGDYSAARHTLIGPGTAQVKRYDRQRAVFEISGAGAQSTLVLHRAIYPNWRAYHNGRPIRAEATSLGKHDFFLGVPAKNGTIEFRYTWPAVNIAGSLISWTAIAALLLLAITARRPVVADKLARTLGPWGRWAERHGVLIGVTLTVIVVAAGAAKAMLRTEGASNSSLLDRIGDAHVELQRGKQRQPCPRVRDRFQCSEASWNYVGAASYRIDGRLRRCIWAHPAAGATLWVYFPRTTLTRRLRVNHGLLDDAVRSFPAGAPVHLQLTVDGGVLRRIVRNNQQGWDLVEIDSAKWAGKSVTVGFGVSSPNVGGRHFCFDAMMLP